MRKNETLKYHERKTAHDGNEKPAKWQGVKSIFWGLGKKLL
jgi:hypothetical protein